MLGPVFARALGEEDEAWAAHLARLADFWSSLMLRTGRYHGDPFSAHLRLPDLEPMMFERWLKLFGNTCAELFEPEVADAFRLRAERVARSLRMGLFERLPARTPGRQQALVQQEENRNGGSEHVPGAYTRACASPA